MSDAPLCPNFDTCDGVHGVGLTLGQLDEVFRYCSGDYARCPVFARPGVGGRGDAAADGLVECTLEGRAPGLGSEAGREAGLEAGLELGPEGLVERGGGGGGGGTAPDGAEGDGRRDPGLRLRAS